MTDITSLLTSLCTIVFFGTFLVAWPPRRLHQVIQFVAFGAMLCLFIRKYFFAHPVMAPIGRDLDFWLGMVIFPTGVAACVLVVRKLRRLERARQAQAQ